jgi:CelD/BcsL family acetyltransferase involved in cellulose biosynthesis
MPFTVAPESIYALEPHWNHLLSSSGGGNVFSSWEFQSVWFETIGRNCEPVTLAVRDNGRLVGIIPLVLKGQCLAFSGGEDVSDYLDMLIEKGSEIPALTAFMSYLEENPWGQVELFSLRANSPTLKHLPVIAAQYKWHVEVSEQDVCPIVCLPDNWDSYLASLNKKDRHELRRKIRRLENDETSEFCLGTNLAEDTLNFLKLHKNSDDDKAIFMTDEMEEFFKRIAQELEKKGQYGMYLIKVAGKVVSAVMCFFTPTELLLYNSGFDRNYGHLSVGLLTKAFCLRDAIERGLPVFNFLRGREPYKYHLGGKDEIVYRMLIRRQPLEPMEGA